MGEWMPYLMRYREGEWRAPIFRDMVLDDARLMGQGLTFLDIGCGSGFDGNKRLQKSLAAAAGSYIGVEPDKEVRLESYFTETHSCLFEDAPLRPGSVNVAFAVMVLEHLSCPGRFWDKLWDVLAEGGIFWGFTMDGRHTFCRTSQLAERMRIKEFYLNRLRGVRGVDRYENYPVYYRSNTPRQIRKYAGAFRSCDFVNFSRVGQLNYYLPRVLRPLANWADGEAMRRGRPGPLLAVRVSK